MNKHELRTYAKQIRFESDINLISKLILARIVQMQGFQNSQNILLFYPKKDEINLLGLCNFDKNFYLPKVDGENLLICPFDCNTKLKKSEFNIQEPCSQPISPTIIDFAIIPCLMADEAGYRLGYGGGFYDKFLPKLRDNCIKITPCPTKLLTHKLPHDYFDIKMDFIITDKISLRC